MTKSRPRYILLWRANRVLFESESWRPAVPSAAQPKRPSRTREHVVRWIGEVGLCLTRKVGQVAQCVAMEMRAMYQFSERRAVRGSARANGCSRFVLLFRRALNWARSRSKIEIAGGIEIRLHFRVDRVHTQSESWRPAVPSAAQPKRPSRTREHVVRWIGEVGLCLPSPYLALHAISANR